MNGCSSKGSTAQARYWASPKGKAAKARYRASAKGKATRKAQRVRYAASPQGKAAQARYAASAKGPANQKACMSRYRASAKGKANRRARSVRYYTSPQGKAARARHAASAKGKATSARTAAKRRTRVLALEVNDLTGDQWSQILEAHHGSCAYCGRNDMPITMDHVIPLSKGGQHTMSNIVPACQSCNSRKGAKVPNRSTKRNLTDV